MQKFMRYFGMIIVTCLALTLFLTAPAKAQGDPKPTGLDPASIDVAGVNLGMTPDEAIASLKKFNSHFQIRKLYRTNPNSYWDDTGATSEMFDHKGVSYCGDNKSNCGSQYKSLAYLNALGAVDFGNEKIDIWKIVPSCDSGWHNCFMHCKVDNFLDDVMVWFSPIPGKERVIAVVRIKEFEKKQPTVDSLKVELFKKYPEVLATYQRQKTGSGYFIGWLFDSDRRLMSSERAKSNGQFYDPNSYDPSGAGAFPTPGSASEGDGVCLRFAFYSTYNNDGIVRQMAISLLNGDGLSKSIAQSQTTFDELKAKADAKEVEKASKSQSKTNF